MEAKIERRAIPASVTEVVRARPITAAAAAVAALGAATILGAWFFQYGLGYQPCPMCLQERFPYYFAIPLAVLVVLGEQVGASRKVLLLALLAIAAGMLWNAGFATYHAGVEWKLWEGPRDCTGNFAGLGAGGLLKQLQSIHVPRCDEAAWTFLGISLAGYDALISLMLAVIAGAGFWAGWKQQRVAE
ncbi:MAG TPA: disulfide bond formation protein B [Xanthobacteraceae bacterium]|nr:disulfide bond formation protein B [Xanthobacteraceae bacterium]